MIRPLPKDEGIRSWEKMHVERIARDYLLCAGVWSGRRAAGSGPGVWQQQVHAAGDQWRLKRCGLESDIQWWLIILSKFNSDWRSVMTGVAWGSGSWELLSPSSAGACILPPCTGTCGGSGENQDYAGARPGWRVGKPEVVAAPLVLALSVGLSN